MREAVRIAKTAQEGQQSVSLSTSSGATSSPIGASKAIVYATVECFIMNADTATVAAGTPIPANTDIPVVDLDPTAKIAAITASGTGTLYIRPDA